MGILKCVKRREWLFVEVSEIVQKDGLCGRRGYCKDIAGRIPGRKICPVQVELPTGILGRGIPYTERVVLTTGEEVVLARV